MLSAPVKFGSGVSSDSYARTWGGLSVVREGPKSVPAWALHALEHRKKRDRLRVAGFWQTRRPPCGGIPSGDPVQGGRKYSAGFTLYLASRASVSNPSLTPEREREREMRSTEYKAQLSLREDGYVEA